MKKKQKMKELHAER
jgi:hypothetical protein